MSSEANENFPKKKLVLEGKC